MSKNKNAKKFMANPETKAFAKKFAEEIAEIIVDKFKDSKDNKTSFVDMEKEIQSAFVAKESEFKDQIQKMSKEAQKVNQKANQRNHLTRVVVKSYSS